MKQLFKYVLAFGCNFLVPASYAYSADNLGLRQLTEKLTVCQGKLSASELYQGYVDDLENLTRKTNFAVGLMRRVSDYEVSAIKTISNRSADDFGLTLISQPRNARKSVSETVIRLLTDFDSFASQIAVNLNLWCKTGGLR